MTLPAATPSPTSRRLWRRLAILLAVLLIGLPLLGLVLKDQAARLIASQLVAALGPRAQVGKVETAWGAVRIQALRVTAPVGWPGEDELRVDQLTVEPDMASLFQGTLRIHRVSLDGAYLSLWRPREGGFRLLPSLLETGATQSPQGSPTPASPSPAHPIQIDEIRLTQASLDYFDGAISEPPHRLHVDELHGHIGRLHYPEETPTGAAPPIATPFELSGRLGNGQIELSGEGQRTPRHLILKTRLHHVDLRSFQPYLVKTARTGIRRGFLDLDMTTDLSGQTLRAPGTLTLRELELTANSRFLGLPQEALLALVKDRQQGITVSFLLEGRLDDPRFSLREHLLTRVGAAVAENLGLSVEGLARGIGQTGSSAAKGISETLGKVFKR